MKSSAALAGVLAALLAFGASNPDYRLALPGYRYEFPRDHFNHPDFQTEWWYYTGNLKTAEGRRFGFELTFFRQGVNRDSEPKSVWEVKDVWMAHLALSDVDGKQFFHTERLNRSGPGIAGADLQLARVWNGNWQARWRIKPGAPYRQTLHAEADRFSFQLDLTPEKPPVIHGINGVSQKAAGEGKASHYISLTRLSTSGHLTLDGKPFAVEGSSWMDHEFFTHQLEAQQSGWDWFSLQLENGTELMLFRLRRMDGSLDPYSAGTYIDQQGRARNLKVSDFSLVPGRTWISPVTHGRYPVEWTLQVPPLGWKASIRTALDQQELTSTGSLSPVYWEGAIEILGTNREKPVKGVGYLEMTGYAGPGMQ